MKERHTLRALLDTGSNRSFIAQNCIQQLHLRELYKQDLIITSFGKTKKHKQCPIVQASIFQNFKSDNFWDLNLIAVESICKSIPSYCLTAEQEKFIKDKGLALADQSASIAGSLEIDLLIGQDYYHRLVRDGKLELPEDLVLIPSFSQAYILSGRSITVSPKPRKDSFPDYRPVMTVSAMPSDNLPPITSLPAMPFETLPSNKEEKGLPSSILTPVMSVSAMPFETLTPEEEQHSIDRFSTLEALGINRPEAEISPVLNQFNNNTVHNGDRWVVKLPWKEPKRAKLETNFKVAFNRLVSCSKRHKMARYKVEGEKYAEIMREQIEQGVLEKVQAIGTINEVYKTIKANPNTYDNISVNVGGNTVHYMPHHGVYKASTMKLRIVYDGSSRPGKGAYSLNDCLEPGPNLMNSLVHILLRFRKGKFACMGDIVKAFLQVEIDEPDRDALRLLWIEGDQVWVYRFARLPFGITSAPFILAAVMLKQLSESDLSENMKDQIFSAFYVDDEVLSADTLEELVHLKDISVKTFAKAGMKLDKWNSNHPEARKLFQKETDDKLPDTVTVLGLLWELDKDHISIFADRILEIVGKAPRTKRMFWSFISRLYDPLGLLAPYTVNAKILTRMVTAHCKGWNSKLPNDIARRVTKWMDDFKNVSSIKLPRHVGLHNGNFIRLVGFSDASSKAIGACVYLVSSNDKETVSNLLFAKTRLAPKPARTIPDLELIAALLLANIMDFVKKDFPEIPQEEMYYFTDSAIVLFDLHSGSYTHSIFVANRLLSIRKLSDIQQWKHVDTKQNPADIPSRGCSLSDLKNNNLWWHGPDFIKSDIHGGLSTLKDYDRISKHVTSNSNNTIPVDKNMDIAADNAIININTANVATTTSVNNKQANVAVSNTTSSVSSCSNNAVSLTPDNTNSKVQQSYMQPTVHIVKKKTKLCQSHVLGLILD